jgi:hypothetical protein
MALARDEGAPNLSRQVREVEGKPLYLFGCQKAALELL